MGKINQKSFKSFKCRSKCTNRTFFFFFSTLLPSGPRKLRFVINAPTGVFLKCPFFQVE